MHSTKRIFSNIWERANPWEERKLLMKTLILRLEHTRHSSWLTPHKADLGNKENTLQKHFQSTFLSAGM